MQTQTKEAVISPFQGLQANSVSCNALGNICALGCRHHVALVQLQNPKLSLKTISLSNNTNTTKLQWNPTPSHKDLIIITYYTGGEIWKMQDDGSSAKLAVIKGHTRAISDIDWSRNPDILATCSIDTYINVWDIREIKRQKLSMSTVAGASQVKWNKNDNTSLATAHEGDIRIWDIRNHSTPVHCISGHVSKIHSLDWSPCGQYELVSAGADTTVRFWNVAVQTKYPSDRIHTGVPVWKARYTPDGLGIVTALRQQLRRWEENSLLLWSTKDLSKAVQSFVGHRDVVLDFDWRCCYSDQYTDNVMQSKVELLTWGKDQTLRQWQYSPQQLNKDINAVTDNFGMVEINEATEEADNKKGFKLEYSHSRSNSYGGGMLPTNEYLKLGMSIPESAERPKDLGGSSSPFLSSSPLNFSAQFTPSPLTRNMFPLYNSIEDEIKYLARLYPSWTIEKIDIGRNHSCQITVSSQNHIISLLISFPPNYPNEQPPEFRFSQQTTLPQPAKQKLLGMLNDTAHQQVVNNRYCLEACFRHFPQQVEGVMIPEFSMIKRPSYQKFLSRGPYMDTGNIPFSKTSGAKFCGNGFLVYFMRPTQVKGFEKTTQPTPRSLAALDDFRPYSSISDDTSPYNEYSVKPYLYVEKKPRKFGKQKEVASGDAKLQTRLHKAAGKVMYQDLSSILPVNKILAQKYIVPSDDNYSQACRHNKQAASSIGRTDLVELWSFLELLPPKCIQKDDIFYSIGLFGREFLDKIMEQYSALNDIQTLAMLACIYARNKPTTPVSNYPMLLRPKEGSYNSFEDDDSDSYKSNSFCENSYFAKNLSSPESFSKNHSLPRSDSLFSSDFDCMDTTDQIITNLRKDDEHLQLLPVSKYNLYETFKTKYCEILDHWHLLPQKADIQKYILRPDDEVEKIDFQIQCKCGNYSNSRICSECQANTRLCSYCHQPVKMLLTICYLCAHGGHPDHMKDWFKENEYCPSGCGCSCANIN